MPLNSQVPDTLPSSTFFYQKGFAMPVGHSALPFTCMILNGSCFAGEDTPLELHVIVMFPVTERLVRAPAKLTVETICWKLFSGWEGKTETSRERQI